MKKENVLTTIIVALTLGVGVWSVTCLVSALAFVGWSPAQLFGSYLTSIGTPNTLVEYYSQIKGVEYIVCASFLALFPLYFKYVNKTKEVKVKA